MAAPEPRLSSRATAELRSILRDSRRDWGEEQANRYQTTLNDAFHRLALFPELGVERADLGGVRTFPVLQHLVVYRPRAYGVFILRVIHQRRSLRGFGSGS